MRTCRSTQPLTACVIRSKWDTEKKYDDTYSIAFSRIYEEDKFFAWASAHEHSVIARAWLRATSTAAARAWLRATSTYAQGAAHSALACVRACAGKGAQAHSCICVCMYACSSKMRYIVCTQLSTPSNAHHGMEPGRARGNGW